MNLKSNDLGDFQRLAEQVTHILKMSQDSGRIDVSFPTVSDVAIKGEGVVEAVSFDLGLGHKLGQSALKVANCPS